MFAKLKKWLFGLPTVEDVLTDIAAKIEKLHLVADIHAAEADAHAAEIELRANLESASRSAVAKAKSIAAKFEALIS